MEPLVAIGLVGNIVQFVDFTSKLVSKTVENYHSADGAFMENTDLETATNDLLALNERIRSNTTIESTNPALASLCCSCCDVANELLTALTKLKVQGGKSKWKSFGKALRSVWSKEKVLGIEKRLSSFRDEINLHILVDLREQLDIVTIKQSDSYKKLEDKTREILDLITDRHDVFNRDTQAQTAEIKSMHTQTNNTIIEQHDVTRIEIIEAIQITKQNSEAAQQATQEEIVQIKMALQQLSEQMKAKDAELKELLEAFCEVRNPKKKKSLQEQSDAVSATLLALEVMYRSLQTVLKSMQTRAKAVLEPLKSVQMWRIQPYPVSSKSKPTQAFSKDIDPNFKAVDPYSSYFYSYLYSERLRQELALVDRDELDVSRTRPFKDPLLYKSQVVLRKPRVQIRNDLLLEKLMGEF